MLFCLHTHWQNVKKVKACLSLSAFLNLLLMITFSYSFKWSVYVK